MLKLAKPGQTDRPTDRPTESAIAICHLVNTKCHKNQLQKKWLSSQPKPEQTVPTTNPPSFQGGRRTPLAPPPSVWIRHCFWGQFLKTYPKFYFEWLKGRRIYCYRIKYVMLHNINSTGKSLMKRKQWKLIFILRTKWDKSNKRASLTIDTCSVWQLNNLFYSFFRFLLWKCHIQLLNFSGQIVSAFSNFHANHGIHR